MIYLNKRVDVPKKFDLFGIELNYQNIKEKSKPLSYRSKPLS